MRARDPRLVVGRRGVDAGEVVPRRGAEFFVALPEVGLKPLLLLTAPLRCFAARIDVGHAAGALGGAQLLDERPVQLPVYLHAAALELQQRDDAHVAEEAGGHGAAVLVPAARK